MKKDKKEPNNENSRGSHRILEFYYTYPALKKIGLFLQKKRCCIENRYNIF